MGDNRDLDALITAAADQAAQKSLRETFRLFGVDIEEQDEVNDFRADLIYVRKLRRMSERSAQAAFLAVAAAIGGGMVTIFWQGIKSALVGKH